LFRGRFEHNVDDKGRIAIPSRYRESIIDVQTCPTLVITNSERCLAAYPLKEWEALETKLASLPQFDPKVTAFQRYFISGAVECPIDKAGRVLLPSNLREYAAIERDCIIAGRLTKFEIWSEERWSEEFNILSDQFSTIISSMSELNINL